MTCFLRKHKIVITLVLSDLFLYWFLFYSGVVLPFINPSVVQYKKMLLRGTSFPRNTNQMLIWYLIHFPTSYIIAGIMDKLIFLSAIQIGIITYFIQKIIKRWRVKYDMDEKICQ